MNMKNIKDKLAELAKSKENNVEIEIEMNKKDFYKFSDMLDDYGFYDYEIVEESKNPNGTTYYYMILKRRDNDFDEYGKEVNEDMDYNYSGFDVSDDCQDYIIEYTTEVGDAESGPFVSESSILVSAMNEEEAKEIAEKMLGNEEDVIGYKVRLATEEDIDNYYDDAYDNIEVDDEFENAPGWGVEESLEEVFGPAAHILTKGIKNIINKNSAQNYDLENESLKEEFKNEKSYPYIVYDTEDKKWIESEMWITSEKDDDGYTFKQFSFGGNDDYRDYYNINDAKEIVRDWYDDGEHAFFKWIKPGFDVSAYKKSKTNESLEEEMSVDEFNAKAEANAAQFGPGVQVVFDNEANAYDANTPEGQLAMQQRNMEFESLQENNLLQTGAETIRDTIGTNKETGKRNTLGTLADVASRILAVNGSVDYPDDERHPMDEKPSNRQPWDEKPTSIHDLIKHGNI